MSSPEHAIKDSVKNALDYFLTKLEVEIPTYERDTALERRVDEIIRSYPGAKPTHPHIVTAIVIAITGYQHIQSFDAKVLIAVYTAIATTLDSPEVLDSLASRDFHRRFCAGAAQHDDDMLGQLARLMVTFWDHYPRYAASSAMASTLEFVNISILENTSHGMIMSSDSLPFIEYRRAKSGIPEAYAAFIWERSKFPDEKIYLQAVPDAMLYIDYVNDIMSFYKEESSNEEGTYLRDRARATGKTPLEALYELIDEVVTAANRARKILGEGPAREAWECFMKGYIAFHTSSPRYRLHEIMDVHYIMTTGA
ncbi:terpene cyclase [Gelatoporia subvermispora B]|uniref:Terpene cyclase n=1 Tax=Ceriporiopsis subvermispora (strain B) TaxID=914234 RepID=M2QZX0_CERS8|nr:terpene cyclase [Gelatoporia subvermispora B]